MLVAIHTAVAMAGSEPFYTPRYWLRKVLLSGGLSVSNTTVAGHDSYSCGRAHRLKYYSCLPKIGKRFLVNCKEPPFHAARIALGTHSEHKMTATNREEQTLTQSSP